ASNTVQIESPDLAGVGKLIDASTSAGANNIESLEFLLKDETAARSRALKEAAVHARSKADALASALNLKIVRILRVEESTGNVVPIRVQSMMKSEMAAPSTPVESGSLQIDANVTLSLEVQ